MKKLLPLLGLLVIGLIGPAAIASERQQADALVVVAASPTAGASLALTPGLVVVNAAAPLRTPPVRTTLPKPAADLAAVAAPAAFHPFARSAAPADAGPGAVEAGGRDGMPSPAAGIAAVILMIAILVGRRNRYGA